MRRAFALRGSTICLVFILISLPAWGKGMSSGSLSPPDPDQSFCSFPDRVASNLDTIRVTVIAVFGWPVRASYVEVEIVLETGKLDPGQQLLAMGITDTNGEVEIVFPDGISGAGTFHFEVRADGIELCTSSPYTIASQPVPVQPTTWGRIKMKYGN